MENLNQIHEEYEACDVKILLQIKMMKIKVKEWKENKVVTMQEESPVKQNYTRVEILEGGDREQL